MPQFGVSSTTLLIVVQLKVPDQQRDMQSSSAGMHSAQVVEQVYAIYSNIVF